MKIEFCALSEFSEFDFEKKQKKKIEKKKSLKIFSGLNKPKTYIYIFLVLGVRTYIFFKFKKKFSRVLYIVTEAML